MNNISCKIRPILSAGKVFKRICVSQTEKQSDAQICECHSLLLTTLEFDDHIDEKQFAFDESDFYPYIHMINSC